MRKIATEKIQTEKKEQDSKDRHNWKRTFNNSNLKTERRSDADGHWTLDKDRQAISRNSQNKADRHKSSAASNQRPTDRLAVGPTDRPTDRPTDGVAYRVACTRLKTHRNP